MEKTRKRGYRQRIKCVTCGKEIDSDYKAKHIEIVHAGAGQTVTFTELLEKSQQTLSNFLVKTPATKKDSSENKGESHDSNEDVVEITDVTELKKTEDL